MLKITNPLPCLALGALKRLYESRKVGLTFVRSFSRHVSETICFVFFFVFAKIVWWLFLANSLIIKCVWFASDHVMLKADWPQHKSVVGRQPRQQQSAGRLVGLANIIIIKTSKHWQKQNTILQKQKCIVHTSVHIHREGATRTKTTTHG